MQISHGRQKKVQGLLWRKMATTMWIDISKNTWIEILKPGGNCHVVRGLRSPELGTPEHKLYWIAVEWLRVMSYESSVHEWLTVLWSGITIIMELLFLATILFYGRIQEWLYFRRFWNLYICHQVVHYIDRYFLCFIHKKEIWDWSCFWLID